MSDLSVGSTFAGCRLEAVAGRGGMGIVYRGTQLALGRQVALKAMAPDLAQDDAYRDRFQRESHIAASIDHPNVIPVYEAGELDGTLYLLMRWVDGTDLRTRLIQAARLSPSRALALLRPVASALSAAHRRDLVHRDIKPANVLIARGEQGDEEHVYLTDFGIARRTDGEASMTKTGVFVGTVDYTAPERLEGSRGDARSDIYSFGCMLFESVTGHVPFERPTEISKIFAHMSDPVPSAHREVPDVPEALDRLIEQTMAKRPEDRLGSAAELAAVIGELQQEIDTEEVELRRRPVPPTRARRPPEPASAAAAPVAAHSAAPAATQSAAPAATLSAAVARYRTSPSRWLIVAPLAAAAVIVVVLIAALGGGGAKSVAGGGAANASSASEVLSLRGAGMSLVRTIDLGAVPGALASGVGANLWVTLPGPGVLVRVGPLTGQTRRFPVGGHPRALADGPGGLWVGGSGAGGLVRYRPLTGTRAAVAQVPGQATAVAADPNDGSAWVAQASGQIAHIGTTGALLGAPTELSPAPAGIGLGEGWLWAVGGGAGGLARIDPGTSPRAQRMAGGSTAVAVSFDQGVWAAHADGSVTRFDPRPGHLAVNTEVSVAPTLDGIAAIEGRRAVWTISGRARRLYRVSTAANARVTGTVTFAAAPVALAFAGQYVWVATADGRLTQIRV